jgi:hypothetical protein
VVGLTNTFFLASGWFTGYAADRLGHRWVILAGTLCATAALLASSLSTAVWHVRRARRSVAQTTRHSLLVVSIRFHVFDALNDWAIGVVVCAVWRCGWHCLLGHIHTGDFCHYAVVFIKTKVWRCVIVQHVMAVLPTTCSDFNANTLITVTVTVTVTEAWLWAWLFLEVALA